MRSRQLPDLRDPYGILVLARSAESTAEVSLTAGDDTRTLNGDPMTTLAVVRQTLHAIRPGTPIALQIQRDHLLFLSFTLDQTLCMRQNLALAGCHVNSRLW